MTATTRFAVLETSSGFVWGVVDAASPLAACQALDNDLGADRDDGHYEEHGIHTPRAPQGAYDVRVAPADFTVQDGQDKDEIAVVESMPRAGVFAWVAAEQ